MGDARHLVYTGPQTLSATQRRQLLANVSPSAYNATALITGGLLSINADNTKFDVASGYAAFVDSLIPQAPLQTTLNFAAQTAISVTNIASAPSTYIGIDVNGTIIQQVTPFTATQRRTIASLGVLIHTNLSTINAINTIAQAALFGINQLQDLIESIGPINISGNVFSANGANLSINKTSGTIFKYGANFHNDAFNPHIVSLSSGTAITFRYRNRNGETGGDVSAIDTVNYDDGGTTTALATNKFSLQCIVVFQSGLVRIQRGQTQYDTLQEAVDAASSLDTPFVYEQNIKDNGILRGWLAVKKGCTDLTIATDAKFIPNGKFNPMM